MNSPEIINAEQMAKFLNKAMRTIYNYTGRREWKDGIYIGRGMYNKTKLIEYITKAPYKFLNSVR